MNWHEISTEKESFLMGSRERKAQAQDLVVDVTSIMQCLSESLKHCADLSVSYYTYWKCLCLSHKCVPGMKPAKQN